MRVSLMMMMMMIIMTVSYENVEELCWRWWQWWRLVDNVDDYNDEVYDNALMMMIQKFKRSIMIIMIVGYENVDNDVVYDYDEDVEHKETLKRENES